MVKNNDNEKKKSKKRKRRYKRYTSDDDENNPKKNRSDEEEPPKTLFRIFFTPPINNNNNPIKKKEEEKDVEIFNSEEDNKYFETEDKLYPLDRKITNLDDLIKLGEFYDASSELTEEHKAYLKGCFVASNKHLLSLTGINYL